MIDHQKAKSYLFKEIDGILSPAERTQLDEHLASCDSCRAEQTALSAFDATLRSRLHAEWDSAPTPPTAYPTLRAAYRRNQMKLTLRTGLLGFAALAALVTLFVVLIPHLKRTGETASPSAIPAETSTAAPEITPTAQSIAPADRLLAYASTESGNSEIYLTRSDGGQSVNITNHPAFDSNPVWSPDGRKIAFESERDGNREIYTMDFDGSTVIRLTNDPANDISPLWSPDGTRILFINDRAGKWDLFTVNADGNNAVQLTQASDITPESYYWSPDGLKVAYITGWTENKPQVTVINADGTGRQPLPPAAAPYSFSFEGWAADSQSVFYSASACSGDCLPLVTHLYQSALDGSEPKKVAPGPYYVNAWLREPDRVIYLNSEVGFMSTTNAGIDHWNWWQVKDGKTTKINSWPNVQEKCLQPDVKTLQVWPMSYFDIAGEKFMVANVYCGTDNKSWQYLLNADGSRIQLLNEKAIEGRVDFPRPSADGRILLYELFSSPAASSPSGTFALDVLVAANDPATSPVRLTATQAQAQPVPFAEAVSVNPAPTAESAPEGQNLFPSSPNGLIVFARREGSTSAIFTMNPDGSDQRRLALPGLSEVSNLRVSPDGSKVALAGYQDAWGLYLLARDGTLSWLSDYAGMAAWSPDGKKLAFLTNNDLRVIGLDGSLLASAPLSAMSGAADLWNFNGLRWTFDSRAVQLSHSSNDGSYPLGKTDRWWIYELDAATSEVRIALTADLPIVSWYGDLVITRDEKSWQWQRARKMISSATPGYCATLDSGPNNIGASWSPDGEWVLFTVDCFGQGSVDLYLARADGSEIRQVGESLRMLWWNDIAWTPDSRSIIFSGDIDAPGNNDIYQLDVFTPDARPIRLTNSGFYESSPVWLP